MLNEIGAGLVSAGALYLALWALWRWVLIPLSRWHTTKNWHDEQRRFR